MSRDLSPAYTLLTKPGALHGAEWPLLHTKPVTPIKCIGEGRLVKEKERERTHKKGFANGEDAKFKSRHGVMRFFWLQLI